MTALLVAKLGHEKLHEVFARADMSDQRIGKIAFGRALDLLTKSERSFIVSLSELRNHVVHDVKNVTFNLRAYVATLDALKRDRFAKAFTLWPDDNVTLEDARHYLTNQPKALIWQTGIVTVAMVSNQVQIAELTRVRDATLREAGSSYLDSLSSGRLNRR